jgi:hypothetical protein
MIPDSESYESYEKSEGKSSKDMLKPTVLLLSGQCVLAEATSTPLYQINSDIRATSNKDSSVIFERLERKIAEIDSETESATDDTPRKRHIFYLAHPTNAQYRTDIAAKYYITSAVPGMIGNIRLEASKTRLQKTSFKAILSPKKSASDQKLFDEATEELLFDIQPNWKMGRDRYSWGDIHGRQIAIEEKEDNIYKLSVSSVAQELRDALVATWLLRLWHDTAESKQAQRECELAYTIGRTLIFCSYFFV